MQLSKYNKLDDDIDDVMILLLESVIYILLEIKLFTIGCRLFIWFWTLELQLFQYDNCKLVIADDIRLPHISLVIASDGLNVNIFCFVFIELLIVVKILFAWLIV